MKPWRTLDRARAPGGAELVLQERDGVFVIRVDGQELMSSRNHDSEDAMAFAAAPGWREVRRAAPHVLVGGLGLGYTARAVLELAPTDARVTVAELSGAVIAWNRGPLAPLAGAPLEDPRVEVEEQDVSAVLAKADGTYSAILLDVDNGPVALTKAGNEQLYGSAGVRRCHQALAPGGVLVVWSAGPDARYLDRLAQAGFRAKVVDAGKHCLFVAARR